MKFDASRAFGAYAAVVTCAAFWFALAAAAPGSTTRFEVIDVQRINVRETDGTLRMVIAGNDRIGGLIIGDTEYPHPGRTEAGMIFTTTKAPRTAASFSAAPL
ncbi:hypothetical protein U91I_02802 [alpha proteobacterium U9-1i]|nr:hypothetical protein U91I_02802 [alpha proteobacterium U9-1i]